MCCLSLIGGYDNLHSIFNLARFAIARMYGLSASVSLCVAFRRLFFSLRPRAPRTLNEMEASKVVKVSVIIHDKYLDDLKGFVTEKGGSVESSETSDVNAACDPGCSDAVPDAKGNRVKNLSMAPKKQCSSKGFRRENFASITRIVFRLHVEGTINYAKNTWPGSLARTERFFAKRREARGAATTAQGR